MNTYTILTNGKQTHRAHGEELPPFILDFFKIEERSLGGPRIRNGQRVVVASVSAKAELKLGKRCPKQGQEFASLADAARWMGAKVGSLYCSYRGEQKEAGCYRLWGVEIGFI